MKKFDPLTARLFDPDHPDSKDYIAPENMPPGVISVSDALAARVQTLRPGETLVVTSGELYIVESVR